MRRLLRDELIEGEKYFVPYVRIFESHNFWSNQEFYFNYKANLTATGSRSQLKQYGVFFNVFIVSLLKNDEEARSLSMQRTRVQLQVSETGTDYILKSVDSRQNKELIDI